MSRYARLNFVLPEELDSALADYRDRTGRKPTEVIRGLLVEWLDGSVSLRERATEHPEGRRTNIEITHEVLLGLEARTAAEGHATVAAVIEALLRSRIVGRMTAEDSVTLVVTLPASLANKFAAVCTLMSTSPEEVFAAHAAALVEQMTAKKEA